MTETLVNIIAASHGIELVCVVNDAAVNLTFLVA